MTSDHLRELQELLSLLCENELGEPESRRLNELLHRDADARRFYLQYVDLHVGLLHHPQLAAFNNVHLQPAAARYQASGERVGATGWRSYAVTAAATLFVSLLVQMIWMRPTSVDGASPKAAPPRIPPYVATLIRGTDCIWGDGDVRRVGARLTPGRASLLSGTAAIHFDSGAELVLKAPVELTVEKANGALLHQGQVVFRSDESAETFRLRTPLSQMVDYGTEYAVVVDENGDELHVFDGEVVRIPKVASMPASVRVVAGQAMRFASGAKAAGQSVPLDASRFAIRKSKPTEQPVDVEGGLLAYDSFDYDVFRLPAVAAESGGIGWTEPWSMSTKAPLGEFRKTFALCRSSKQLNQQARAILSAHRSSMSRSLERPIMLNADGVYYFSFLTRAAKFPADCPCDVQLSFRKQGNSQPQRKLSVTMSWVDGNVALSWEGGGSNASLPIELYRSYLVAGKVVTSAARPDQAFLRVFCPQRTITLDEPTSWSVVSRPVDGNLSFDTVQLQTYTSTPIVFDELRIGTSWAAVVGPYGAPVAEDPNSAARIVP